MRIRALAALAVSLALCVGNAAAQSFPSKPLRVYMPGAPGGSFDTMTRMVMKELSEKLKQPIVVENIAAAGGTLAIDRCLQSEADGHNICVGYVGSLAIAPYIYPNLKYDPVKDLKPIALIGSVSYVLAVPANSRFKTVKDLVDYAKANPGKLNFSSAGNGTGGHVGGELIKRYAKLEMVHVPYQGAAPASVALLGGHVDFGIEALPTAVANVQAGKLRALAQTSPKRHPQLPDVPTMAEQGFPGFDLQGWTAVLAPAGTPDSIVRKLNADINEILRSPELVEAFNKRGAAPMPSTPEEFATYLKAELEQYKTVMAKAKAD